MSIGDGTEPLLIMGEQQTESLKKKILMCVSGFSKQQQRLSRPVGLERERERLREIKKEREIESERDIGTGRRAHERTKMPTYATMRSDSSETKAFFSWTSWIHCSIMSLELSFSGRGKEDLVERNKDEMVVGQVVPKITKGLLF